MGDYQQLLNECREDMLSGRGARVKARMAGLKTSEVPDELRLPLAHLCRRTNEVNVGLRLLTPLVHPKEGQAAASAEVAVEYAALLGMSGATREALIILNTLDAAQASEVKLLSAFCQMSEGNFSGAAQSLNKYLEMPVDEQSKFNAGVTLATVMVMSHSNGVQELISSLIPQAKERGDSRRLAALLELQARLHINSQQWAEAERILIESAGVLSGDAGQDLYSTRKLQGILAALSSNDIEPLKRLLETARQRGDCETVREAELYIQKIQFDQKLFDKLYTGSPSNEFRERIEREIGAGRCSDHYYHGEPGGTLLRLSTGEAVKEGQTLPIPSQALRILKALTRDLYSPLKVAALHAELFPGESFNIFSSPNRVHQSVTRARQWLQANAIPIQIANHDSLFSLKIHGNAVIELSPDSEQNWPDVRLGRLNKVFGSSSFSRKQACEKLNMTPSTFNRIANAGLEHGLLQRFGHGSSVTYRLTI